MSPLPLRRRSLRRPRGPRARLISALPRSAVITAVALLAGVLTGVGAAAAPLTTTSWTSPTPYASAPNSRYDWGFTTATTANLSRAQLSVPAGTQGTVGTRYLDLNDVSGNYATTPNAAANRISGDLDVRARMRLATWTPSTNALLLSKWDTSKAYGLSVNSGGQLGGWLSSDCSTPTYPTSTSVTGFAADSTNWVRMTLTAATGVVTFYTSTSATGTTWTQLGSTVSVGSSFAICGTSTAAVSVGTGSGGFATGYPGRSMYYADVRSSITGTTTSASACSAAGMAACFDPNDGVVGSTSWKSIGSGAETWTVNRSGSNLPADVSADLTVTGVTGLASGGAARVRTIDAVASYVPPTAASVPSGTAVTVGLSGFQNSAQTGNATSTITTYDNAGTPAAVDTAASASLLFVTPISAGFNHACSLSSVGAASCWGKNLYGQLGDGTFDQRPKPGVVSGGLSFASISAGGDHTCALTTAGAAYCWGSNGFSQLGDGSLVSRTTPTAVSGGLTFATLSAGEAHTCALTVGGVAYCWGANTDGRLGDNSLVRKAVPTAVSGGLTFAAIASGGDHTCAVTLTAAAYCWGNNATGGLGDGTTTTRSVPTAAATGLTYSTVTAGSQHSCALTPAGVAWCWGLNSTNQLGDGTTTNRTSRVLVSGGLTFASLGLGYQHSCGVAVSTAAGYCWGLNESGRLGDGTKTLRTSPTAISGSLALATVTTGETFSCAAAATGLYCWGRSDYDQAGLAASPRNSSPVTVAGRLTLATVALGSEHTCGLTAAGIAYCWGANSNGQLGDGSTVQRSIPTAVSTGVVFASLVVGQNHTCGLTAAGAAYCWGVNSAGQLGDGSTTTRSVATAVSGSLSFVSLTAGRSHTCGVLAGGSAYCWGSNSAGALGDGTLTNRSAPTQVSGGPSLASITAGAFSTCGLTSGGAAYCWGGNTNGQLGDSSLTDRVNPVSVSGGLTFTSISAGQFHACGVASGGAAHCWGLNRSGSLGDGTSTRRTAPTAVTGGITFASISAAEENTCATSTGGGGYCWGYNGSGRLGDGTFTNRSAPTAVLGGLSWSQVSAGTFASCGVAGGRAFCWGNNTTSELGVGSITSALVPSIVSPLMTGPTLATSSDFTYASNTTYDWGFTTAGSRTLSKVAMTTPAGTVPSAPTLGLPGIAGNYASTPDSPANSLTGDLDLRVQAAPTTWTPAANQVLLNKSGSDPQRSYLLRLLPTSALQLSWYPTASSTSALNVTSSTLGLGAGTTKWVRATLDVDNGANQYVVKFYTSDDNSTWTQKGSTQNFGGTTSVPDTTAPLEVGGRNLGTLEMFSGDIYYADVRSVIDGPAVAKFDPIEADGSPAFWPSGTGERWTINRSGANAPADLVGNLTVSAVSGLPAGGVATLRAIEGVATYSFSPAVVGGGVAASLSLTGFNNPPTSGTFASTIVSYGTTGSPVVPVESAETGTFPLVEGNTSAPSSLQQYRANGSTVVALAAATGRTAVFAGSVVDTDPSNTNFLCVEIATVGVAFTGNPTACGATGGVHGATVSVSASGLAGGSMHWQARMMDRHARYSPWVSFGGNAESATDFVVDVAGPVGGTVYDGTVNGVQTSLNGGSLSVLSANWSGFSDALTGVASYDYAIGSTPGATDVRAWTGAGSSTAVTATGLTIQTSQPYYFSVRAYDGGGNTSVLTSTGQRVTPTLTVAVDPTLNFGYLVPGQTATATVTVTTSTNAAGGYRLYAALAGPVVGSGGGALPDFGGGSYAAPDSWLIGDTGLGYTSDDTLVGGVNRFQAATCPGGSALTSPGCFAPFSTTGPGEVVADTPGGAAGSSITSEVRTLTVRLRLPTNQPAGVYTGRLHVVASPVY